MSEADGRSKSLIAAVESEPVGATGELESLYREHHALVFRTAYRVTGSASDAEDVLQTVFLRLVGRRSGGSPIDNPGSYLRRAAVNCALDVMRSRQSAPSISLDEVEPVLTDDSSRGPDRVLNSAEIREWVRRAVARLNPRNAEIFALRFFEDKGVAEIAEIIGTTEGTIAVTLHRIRERIVNHMRAEL
ncbi:MAG: RNA polymerase sigma factor [Bryobacteraceae bacterium]